MARKRSAAAKTPMTTAKRGRIAEPGAAGKKVNKQANPSPNKSSRRPRSKSDANAERAKGSQATNEELQSSSEEIQSLNDELHNRNQELTTLNNDLNDLHVSVNIPILMLGRDLRIRRFIPQAEKVLGLIATDVGRPISDIKPQINVPDLEELIVEVIDTGSVKEREVQDREGRWYAMRVRPYQTLDNKIDGAVVVLLDIDALKRSKAKISEARDYAEAIVRTTPNPSLVLSADLRVNTANEAFYRTFKISPTEAKGKLIYDLGNHQWDIPRLRELLEEILPCNSFFDNFEVTHDFESIGRRTMLLNARRLDDTTGQPARILLGIQDTTEHKQTEEALSRRTAEFEALLNEAPLRIYVVDADFRIQQVNPTALPVFGDIPDLIGRDFDEVIHILWPQAYADEIVQRFRHTLETGEPYIVPERGEKRLDRGATESYEWQINRILLPEGRYGVVCYFRDISERVLAQQKIRESEERYRSLFASAPMAVFSCDRNAVIQHYNQRAVELWGREPARGVEQYCGSVRLWLPDGTHLPHAQSSIVDVLRTGIPAPNIELFIERPDGSRLPVLINYAALQNEQGEITGAITSFVDITERKQAEEALRRTAEFDEAVISNMGEGLYTVDSQGLVTFMNPAAEKLFGWTVDQLRGRKMHDATHYKHPDGSAFPAEECAGLQVLHDGKTLANQEDVFIRRDGTFFNVIYSASPLREENENISGLVVVFQDINERKRAEEERARLLASEQQARQEAEEANRTKDEFLATISHELRSPLNAILGWAEMLKRGAMNEESAVHAVETIARNAGVQNQLISDLLDVSRITLGKLRLEMNAIQLIPVIKGAMETVRPAADAKGVELRFSPEHAVGLVSGDASRLQQVVWNLLSNAIKYSSRGRRVDVWLEHEDSNVAIIVRDTGEGIRPEFLPYIFDRFRQADSATTRRHSGLGLGLAIVRHLIELHGGTVRADSGGAGQGATFTVTLPLIAVRRKEDAAQVADPGGTLSGQTPSHKPLTGLRVLVIDDDPGALEVLGLALTLDGADVRAGASAHEVLAILDQWKPDVLVSDIGMPGEDGYDLIRQVRARDEECGGLIPAVALTGYAADSSASHAREAGFQMHLPKPVEHARLIAAVARLAKVGTRSSGNPAAD